MTEAWRTEKLDLRRLRTDGDTQARVAVNEDAVGRYEALYRDEVDLGLPVVFFDGVSYWLADGFTRREAAQRAGLTSLACRVTGGTAKDARWYAAGANAQHGQHLTTEDRLRAVEMALRARPETGDRAIALHCGVSHSTVAKIRQKLEAAGLENPAIRVGADGRERPARPRPEPLAESDEEADAEPVPAKVRAKVEKWLRKQPDWPDEAIAFRADCEPALVAEMRAILAQEEEEGGQHDGTDAEYSGPVVEEPEAFAGDDPEEQPKEVARLGPTDGVGVQIPEKLAGTWEAYHARAKRLLADCQALASSIHETSCMVGGEAFASSLEHRQVGADSAEVVRNVSADLRSLTTKIRQTLPFCSFCVKCVTERGVRSAKECRSCQGRGWTTKEQWNFYGEGEQSLAIVEVQQFFEEAK